MAALRIFYTGDLITPDGSDTGIYGDGCEEGSGETLTTGWVSPDWRLFEVYAERDHVKPDEWECEDGPMIDWIVDRLTDRLGWIDSPEYVSASGETFYASDSIDNYPTGERISLAAHVYGAPPAVMSAVRYALLHNQRRH